MKYQTKFQNAAIYLTQFGGISLIGLVVDFALFNILMTLNFQVFEASLISINFAIVVVYFTSANRIFHNKSSKLVGKFVIYAAYQAIMMFAVSLMLAYIHSLEFPIISNQFALKFLPLPVTFSCNALITYMLMRQ